MLEHSCLTVEGVAKGGGVYPDVLFQVAKYWFDLYVRVSMQYLGKFSVVDFLFLSQ